MTPDRLALEDFSPLGSRPVVFLDLADHDAGPTAAALRPAQAIIIGLDHSGALPSVDADDFDILLTSRPGPPPPWVFVTDIADVALQLDTAVRAQPIAAATLRQVLRLGEGLSFSDALTLESLAYSTLLGGQAFRTWRSRHPIRHREPDAAPFVLYRREADAVVLSLNRPDVRNAVGAGMRDALFEALTHALDDPTSPTVTVTGAGPSFSAGGDLDEFGTATDLGLAHLVRRMRYPAALLNQLGPRGHVILHGACIGAGIEMGAAAHHRIARPDAFFQLPEIGMGLVPGAGGTVTVPRAIGRHRATFLAISGARIDPQTGLDWGLIHDIVAQ